MAAAEQALRRLPRWKLVARDAENDALEAKCGRVGPFTDDVTVYFFAARSRPDPRHDPLPLPVGRGDLGRNAAHIRELQAGDG